MLTRAIRTANLALDVAGRLWLPVHRTWRLNERHYGDLQGKDKVQTVDQFGDEQFMLWRRTYDVPPPPIPAATSSPRTTRGTRLGDALPWTECLKDVVARMLPYWFDFGRPPAGQVVLVAAHGNSLRALIKHLEHISD